MSRLQSGRFNLKTAVGTTDFADNTDKEGTAVEWVFTRRVAAKAGLDHVEALSHPCYPESAKQAWLVLVN
jgi:hypothetical protein